MEKVFYNVCMRDCYDTCSLLTQVKGGKIKVRANPANPVTSSFLCAKGTLLPQWFHSEERLRVPLLRRGDKPSRDFSQATWDEAISIIARKLREVREKYGDRAVLLYYYYGDRGFLNANFPHRLFNYMNASIVEDAICDRAGEEALKDIYGTSQGMDPEELKNEGLIVYWGINAAWTNLHGFVLAKRAGLEMWVVDVVRTATARMADSFYQVKPETDTLFALGVARTIIEEELYDRDFVRKNVSGFDEYARYVESIDMEYVAEETGIEEKAIRRFAEKYAEKRGIIHIGYGFQRSISGGEAVRAIAMLPALVGKERGFIYSSRILPREYVRGEHLRKKEGYRLTQIEVARYLEEGKIKFIFIYGSNPLATLPNQKRLRKAILESGAFIVLHDIFLTDTALFSDVVLPSNTFFERFDIADSYYHRYIAVNEKTTKYAGKSNVEVAKLLARHLGFTEPSLFEDEEEILQKVLDSIGVNLEELRREKVLKVPVDTYAPMTESGKIEFYSKRAVKRGLTPFPVYRPSKRGGLKLITPSHQMLISSQYHNIHHLTDPHIYISAEDAKERGIKDGDEVRVYNSYGEIRTRARVSDELQKGLVVIYKAFWPSLLGWNANFLTPDSGNEGYGGCTTLHTVWVDIERA